MGAGHDHSQGATQERPLWIALGLTLAYLVAEVVGSIVTGSLALLSDAAHMGTDVLGLGIAIAAMRMSKKPADAKRTYGYARVEVFGAVANAVLLLAAAAYVLWEAVQRFADPEPIESLGMIIVAAIGLGVNLISMRVLSASRDDSLNVKGAYLEVWSDMLGSVGVILAGIVVYFTGWLVADPIVAVAIALWVVPRTWKLLRESGHILLEGTPAGIEVERVTAALKAVRGVRDAHHVHVWTLGSGKHALTAHLLLDDSANGDAVIQSAASMLARDFEVDHPTLQVESVDCGPEASH